MSDKPKKGAKNYTLHAEPGSFSVTGGEAQMRVDRSANWARLTFEEKAALLQSGDEPRNLHEAIRERWPEMSGAEKLAALNALEVPRDLWLALAQGGVPAIEAGFDPSQLQQRAAELFALVKPAQVIRLALSDALEVTDSVQVELIESTTTFFPPTVTQEPTVTKTVIVPDHVPQQTWLEARNATQALADGVTGRNWLDVPGELALYHSQPGEPLETKLTWGPKQDWWGYPSGPDSLREELSRIDSTGVILFHYVLHLSLQHERVTVSIEELIDALGLRDAARRTKQADAEIKRRIWRWICLFEGLRSIGHRPKTSGHSWKDPHTKKKLDTVEIDRFIHLGKQIRDAHQLAFDESEPPLAVTFWGGDFIQQNRHNKRVFSYFGEVRRLAAIPGGKAAGNWARSIGLALQQWWREKSAKAQVVHSGEVNKLTVRYPKSITRRELLDRFPFEPNYRDILNGPNPQRAIEYWDEAIKRLRNKTVNVIGHYRELTAINWEKDRSRRGWKEAWLDQPLDIRPQGETLQQSAELAKKGAAARRRQRPQKKTGQPKNKPA